MKIFNKCSFPFPEHRTRSTLGKLNIEYFKSFISIWNSRSDEIGSPSKIQKSYYSLLENIIYSYTK